MGRRWPDNVLPDLSHDAYNLGVIRDGDHFVATHSYPQENRHETTFTIVTSEDGIHWRRNAKPSIKARHFEGQCSLFKFNGKFWMLGQGLSPYYSLPDGGPCGRVMFAYRSKNLKTWIREPDVAFAYPVPKYFVEAAVQNHCGASPVVRGRVVLGFMGQFWPAGFSEFVRSTFGLIYSYDGAHWNEPFSAEPLLMPDEKGWDCGALHQGLGIYSRGSTSYYWYSGFDGGNLWGVRGAIGCARIRRDGFAHFTAADSSAVVETGPVELLEGARNIYVNVHASSNDPIRVEFLDGTGGSRIAVAHIKRSGVLVPVTMAIPPMHQKVSLRFSLRGKSRLYAFYTGPAVNSQKYLADWREG
jgi:hypothetical protein